MGDQLQEQIAELLAPVLPDSLPSCCHDASVDADAVCSACEQLFAWEQLVFDGEADVFRCRECQEKHLAALERSSKLAFLKMPFTYVVLAVLVAGIAFVFGVGNPSPADLAKAERGEEWYLQRYGRYWLAQATRCRRRAAFLESRNQLGEARRWAALAEKAFGATADVWEQTACGVDLRMVQALMQSEAGDPAGGRERLLALGATIGDKHPSRFAYSYFLGKIAVDAGDLAEAKKQWDLVLRATANPDYSRSFDQMVDKLTSIYSKDRRKTLMENKVRGVCGTAYHSLALAELIREEAKRDGVDVVEKVVPDTPFPTGAWRIDYGDDNTSAEEKKEVDDEESPPKPKPNTKLIIKRYDE